MKTTKVFNPTQTKVEMVPAWKPDQFKAMDKAIARHFNDRVFLRWSDGGGQHRSRIYRSFTQVNNILGLAYTSSGVWACYGVCNCEAWFDEDSIYKYSHFTIGTNGNFYAILQDREENELCIAL